MKNEEKTGVPRKRALELILEKATPRKTSTLKPWDAVDRITATDVRSVLDVPTRPVSNRDGYVLCSKDKKRNEQAFEIDEATIYAQTASDSPLSPGAAARILTGAPLPRGADVIIQDETARIENGRLVVKTIHPGRFIRAVGSELGKGFQILDAKEPVSPVSAAMMVMGGVDTVEVFDPPRVKVLCLGSELVDPSSQGRDNGSMPADNLILLTELLRQNNVEHVQAEICPDNLEAISRKMSDTDGFDMVITAGGTGDSERDYALEAAEKSGFKNLYDKVSIRPGSGFMFGVKGETMHFGLPGPPSAVLICFHIFILPAIERLRGIANSLTFRTKGILAKTATLTPGPEWVIYCSLETKGSTLFATPLLKKDMSVTQAMLKAQGLMVCPRGASSLPKGTEVEILLFRPFPCTVSAEQ